MSKNLQALLRYQTINSCLTERSKKKWTWQALAKACGHVLYEKLGIEISPSRRTIMKDIQTMRSGDLNYRAPIVWSKHRGFYYDDKYFSTFQFPLNQSEREELEKGIGMLRHFSGKIGLKGLESIITKLNYLIHKTDRKQIIQFHHQLTEAGEIWLDKIYQNIRNQEALFLTYHPFTHDKPFNGVVSPYLLKEYNNRWFLIAQYHQDQKIYHYALDRIIDIKQSIQDFKSDDNFNSEVYFNKIVGVSIPSSKIIRKITFKVNRLQARYLSTKPIHQSQEIISENNDYLTFRILVIPNYELESLFLSFGENLEVLSPIFFRKRIMKRISQSIKTYSS